MEYLLSSKFHLVLSHEYSKEMQIGCQSVPLATHIKALACESPAQTHCLYAEMSKATLLLSLDGLIKICTGNMEGTETQRESEAEIT